jgi:hypothetical protein
MRCASFSNQTPDPGLGQGEVDVDDERGPGAHDTSMLRASPTAGGEPTAPPQPFGTNATGSDSAPRTVHSDPSASRSSSLDCSGCERARTVRGGNEPAVDGATVDSHGHQGSADLEFRLSTRRRP